MNGVSNVLNGKKVLWFILQNQFKQILHPKLVLFWMFSQDRTFRRIDSKRNIIAFQTIKSRRTSAPSIHYVIVIFLKWSETFFLFNFFTNACPHDCAFSRALMTILVDLWVGWFEISRSLFSSVIVQHSLYEDGFQIHRELYSRTFFC